MRLREWHREEGGTAVRDGVRSRAGLPRADAVVIGAGPYGLSTAAYLAAAGLSVRTFGEPMESWREKMPVGMFLKSTPSASSIAAPRPGSTLADFCAAAGEEPLIGHQPVPIDTFIRYGLWFMDRNVPQVEQTRVERVARHKSGFSVVLGDGEEFPTSNVVVATGLDGVAHVPAELSGLRRLDGCGGLGLVSHSSEHRDLSKFAGRRVGVLGGGQSALENAALLAESGVDVELFVRGSGLIFSGTPTDITHQGRGTPLKPESPLGPGWSLFACSRQPGAFRHLPERTRLWLVAEILGPFGAWWLRPRVDGRLPVHLDHRLVSAVPYGGGVQLRFAVGSERHVHTFDHVMAATGYRPDVDRLDFLDSGLRHRIARTAGTWPSLGPAFTSSVTGLYFTGLAAAATFGPLMRFVCGTGFAAGRVRAGVGSAKAAAAD